MSVHPLIAARFDVCQVLVRRALHGFLGLPAEIEAVDEAFELIADTVRHAGRGVREPALQPALS